MVPLGAALGTLGLLWALDVPLWGLGAQLAVALFVGLLLAGAA